MLSSQILIEAVNKWGIEKQIDVCIEEMAELTKALLKYKRGFASDLDAIRNVQEELADSHICIMQMRHFFGESEVLKYIADKIERLEIKIKR